MNDFAFEEAAKKYPTTSFIHAHPGLVKTGSLKETGPLARLGGRVFLTLFTPGSVNITESGERHFYAATSGKYPAREHDGGVALIQNEPVSKSSDGAVGSGAYLIGSGGEFRGKEIVLKELRAKGAGEKIWQHTLDMFEKVRGLAVVGDVSK